CGFPGHRLGAVLAEFEGLAVVGVRPGAAGAVETVLLVHLHDRLAGACHTHGRHGRLHGVHDAGNTGSPVLGAGTDFQVGLGRFAYFLDVLGHGDPPFRPVGGASAIVGIHPQAYQWGRATARVPALEAAPEARTAEVWSDVECGRFDDIDDGDLDHFIGELGLRAAQAKPTRLMADYRLSHAAQADKVSI